MLQGRADGTLALGPTSRVRGERSEPVASPSRAAAAKARPGFPSPSLPAVSRRQLVRRAARRRRLAEVRYVGGAG